MCVAIVLLLLRDADQVADSGLDVYDSGEKQRVPSWTDRILIRGQDVGLQILAANAIADLKQLDIARYQRAELMLSDHRPGMGPNVSEDKYRLTMLFSHGDDTGQGPDRRLGCKGTAFAETAG